MGGRDFYPRPPGGGRLTFAFVADLPRNFYPRSPGGGRRQSAWSGRYNNSTFLSTPSGWRATRDLSLQYRSRTDFYPRPPGGGRRVLSNGRSEKGRISIHALRVEGDRCLIKFLKIHHVFLSTPSGWRATFWRPSFLCAQNRFLSTPSGWRATSSKKRSATSRGNFYPRPPGGGRRGLGCCPVSEIIISIHALRVEGDTGACKQDCKDCRFLSTPSGWRATGCRNAKCLQRPYFYPRPPGGGRPGTYSYTLAPTDFYPRPPGGGRQLQNLCRCQLGNFYPRSPGGGRPEIDYVLNCMQRISIHALRVEGDLESV